MSLKKQSLAHTLSNDKKTIKKWSKLEIASVEISKPNNNGHITMITLPTKNKKILGGKHSTIEEKYTRALNIIDDLSNKFNKNMKIINNFDKLQVPQIDGNPSKAEIPRHCGDTNVQQQD